MAITSTDANVFVSAVAYSAKIHLPCLYGLYPKVRKVGYGRKVRTYRNIFLRLVKIKNKITDIWIKSCERLNLQKISVLFW